MLRRFVIVSGLFVALVFALAWAASAQVPEPGRHSAGTDTLRPAPAAAATLPGWLQKNASGFGSTGNRAVFTLAPFGGQIYAGTDNGGGAQLWRSNDTVNWTAVITNGFGGSLNLTIDDLLPFGGNLYAGTRNEPNGGELWRSADGITWSSVVTAGFGDTSNGEIFRLMNFGGQLYAATWSYTSTHGAAVWRSSTGNAGDWTQVITGGFGITTNAVVMASEVYSENLYIGFGRSVGQVWRSASGDAGSWTQVNADAFGATGNYVSSLAAFNGYLYAGTSGPVTSTVGSEIWRCQTCDGTDWAKVVNNGFGNGQNRGLSALEVLNGRIYAAVGNAYTGMEVWRSADGTTWNQVGSGGFGDSDNWWAGFGDNGMAVIDNHLFIGTWNLVTGGQIWEYLDRQWYLPLIER